MDRRVDLEMFTVVWKYSGNKTSILYKSSFSSVTHNLTA